MAVAIVPVTEFSTGSVKFALISEFAVTVIEQSTAVPLQLVVLPVPSLHPVKVEPLFATARNTSGVPLGYVAAQVAKAPPFELHVTPPVPLPPFGRIATVAGGGATGKVAVTDESAFRVTEQVPVPVQVALPVPLPQPVNPVPVAVKVTAVLVGKTAAQVPNAQVIPAGVDVTVPLLTMVMDKVLNELCKCVVAVGSDTSVSPGKEVSKPAAVKSMVAGKFGGAFAGSTMGFPGAGAPPDSVSSNCDKFTT